MKKSLLSNKENTSRPVAAPSVFSVLKPYRLALVLLIFLAFASNGLGLLVPRLLSRGIDEFQQATFALNAFLLQFAAVALLILGFSYSQSFWQTFLSERVARDLREQLSSKISLQSFSFVQETTPSRLLTNLTSDVDAVKMFVAQAVVSMASSVFLLVGASLMLLSLNWKLALIVLGIIPLIGVTFFFIFSKVRVLFLKSQSIIDRLNKVINESILGASLIRVLFSQQSEYEKFLSVNTDARDTGMSILKLFAGLIPIISLVANLATLAILVFGGHFVISGSLSLGNFLAFNTYLMMLIFPIILLGFVSTVIARASASYGRISEVLSSPVSNDSGTRTEPLSGEIEFQNVSLCYGEKKVLQNISFSLKAGTKTALIGPTAAGKTQLLHLLTGLHAPSEGTILFDGHPQNEYESESFHHQVGIVFQDSVLFQMSLQKNIVLNSRTSPEDVAKAIDTAELTDFIASLPDGLETQVSERGTSLSGGQKQRVMLARALCFNPKILLLDDFTARVDAKTEQKILKKVHQNYPGLTLLSITQKISSIQEYDQILVLMEGELLARGTHQELMETSPDYVQIFHSQRSTSHYELSPE